MKISTDLGLHVNAFSVPREFADAGGRAWGDLDRRSPPLKHLLAAFAALPSQESRLQAIAMVESLVETTRSVSS